MWRWWMWRWWHRQQRNALTHDIVRYRQGIDGQHRKICEILQEMTELVVWGDQVRLTLKIQPQTPNISSPHTPNPQAPAYRTAELLALQRQRQQQRQRCG